MLCKVHWDWTRSSNPMTKYITSPGWSPWTVAHVWALNCFKVLDIGAWHLVHTEFAFLKQSSHFALRFNKTGCITLLRSVSIVQICSDRSVQKSFYISSSSLVCSLSKWFFNDPLRWVCIQIFLPGSFKQCWRGQVWRGLRDRLQIDMSSFTTISTIRTHQRHVPSNKRPTPAFAACDKWKLARHHLFSWLPLWFIIGRWMQGEANKLFRSSQRWRPLWSM